MQKWSLFSLFLLLSGSTFCKSFEASDSIPLIIEETRVSTSKECRRGRFVKSFGNLIFDLYAPLVWKEKYYGFDWKNEVSISFNKAVSEDMSSGAFYCEIKRLLNLLRDPHCLVTSVYPHIRKVLPIYLCCADGKLFVQDVHYGFLRKVVPGSRIIEINSRPAEEVFSEKLQSVFGKGPYPNWAKYHVCELLVRQGPPFDLNVSDRPVFFRLKEPNGKVSDVSVDWVSLYEDHVFYPTASQSFLLHSARRSSLSTHQFFVHGKCLNDTPAIGSLSNFFSGSRGSFLAPLGNLLWSSRSNPEACLEAYIAEVDNRRAGYLRLPDFSSWSTEECVDYLAYFEKEVDYLVLDMMHNPGGSGMKAMYLCSLFSSNPARNHPEMMRLSPVLFDWVKELAYVVQFPESKRAKECLEAADFMFDVSTKSLSSFSNFCNKVTESLYQESGDAWPLYWLGLETLEPQGVYTKPLFILCDSLSMSATESFLLLMQLNRVERPVWILGSRTAGVVGAYDSVSLPNIDGIREVSYSWSLLLDPRTNKPIEDIGITPDFVCEFSEQDIQDSFSLFRKRILSIINKNLDVGRVGLYSY
ncbi:S41 family peptidase [Candidatus Similichlamydia epinepheli]|uniref:S41 family peptidase n=1 Tax=Candidatus Similichlamydia epinepheli TaxID=1903953 RepID=UPI000D36B08D|nr:S41 family peptidase [Candidatus Similichlamydia epinepheli]